MIEPNKIVAQCNRILIKLIEIGLANKYNPLRALSEPNQIINVGFGKDEFFSAGLKDVTYQVMYEDFFLNEVYTCIFFDGSMLLLNYEFQKKGTTHTLNKHRLCFFHNPNIDEFLNSEEFDEDNVLHQEIAAKSIVRFPLRFDFDAREDVYISVNHPKSHLTLGQNLNCRIPVNRPVSPLFFVDFIIRNFYSCCYASFEAKLFSDESFFDESISEEEKGVLNINIPKYFIL